jgi:large subunit ribosomal protein L24e
MVVKRQCSFCAAEIEPGTGMMFVKRDGSIFHFCTSSCRKQQLHLGRVGHRLKWTRAHALKKAADRSAAAARPTGAKPARGSKRPQPTPAPAPAVVPEAKSAPAAPVEPVAAAPPAAEEPKPKAPPKPRPRAKKPAAEKAKDTP